MIRTDRIRLKIRQKGLLKLQKLGLQNGSWTALVFVCESNSTLAFLAKARSGCYQPMFDLPGM